MRVMPHTINLTVQHAIANTQPLQQKAKVVVLNFKRSSQAQEKLFQFQRENITQVPKKLVQDVPTRLNSTYLMFQRIVDLEGSIKSAVAHIKMDHDLLVLTHEEWLICTELCKV